MHYEGREFESSAGLADSAVGTAQCWVRSGAQHSPTPPPHHSEEHVGPLAGPHGSRGAQERWFTLNNNLPNALSFPTHRNLSRKGKRAAWMKKTPLIQLKHKY